MPGLKDNRLQRLVAAVNQMFFSRCIANLKSMPLIARLLLASPYLKDAYSRPFRLLFLCYCINVLSLESDTLLEKHSFSFTAPHFVAVLGINSESRQLRPAHLFTYILAGIVYISRALLAEYIILTAYKQGNLIYFIGKLIPINAIQAIVYKIITDAETLL
ncbi:hypothetical protein J3F84DRAFT_406238 [Trichoderma pleuroticola]